MQIEFPCRLTRRMMSTPFFCGGPGALLGAVLYALCIPTWRSYDCRNWWSTTGEKQQRWMLIIVIYLIQTYVISNLFSFLISFWNVHLYNGRHGFRFNLKTILQCKILLVVILSSSDCTLKFRAKMAVPMQYFQKSVASASLKYLHDRLSQYKIFRIIKKRC